MLDCRHGSYVHLVQPAPPGEMAFACGHNECSSGCGWPSTTRPLEVTCPGCIDAIVTPLRLAQAKIDGRPWQEIEHRERLFVSQSMVLELVRNGGEEWFATLAPIPTNGRDLVSNIYTTFPRCSPEDARALAIKWASSVLERVVDELNAIAPQKTGRGDL